MVTECKKYKQRGLPYCSNHAKEHDIEAWRKQLDLTRKRSKSREIICRVIECKKLREVPMKYCQKHGRELDYDTWRSLCDRKSAYKRERYRNDLVFRMICRARSRHSAALKSKDIRKNSSTYSMLGVTSAAEYRGIILQLLQRKGFDESQLDRDHPQAVQIDHMMSCDYCMKKLPLPLCERVRRAFHWSNLQALPARVNNSKSKKCVTNLRWSQSQDRWVYTDGTPNVEKVGVECKNENSKYYENSRYDFEDDDVWEINDNE
jgi:hypothetical protein